jgi:23S rRNA (uracil1939-C5)-methyltransferase
LGEQTFCVWGQPYITDYIRQFSFQISPQSFYQINPAQTEKLYGIALDFAGLTGTESVWDLYCGIGTISLFLSQRAKQVYGVEIVPQAIADAKDNAKRNGVTNVEFFVGKAEEVLPEFYERESRKAGGNAFGAAQCAGGGVTDERARDDVGSTGASSGRVGARSSAGNNTGKPAGDAAPSMLRPDVIVVDPPRKGCDEKCLDVMLKMQPERIVYVSCDSATLARDLKVLCDGGYEIKKVQAVDQFGQTVHVEVATCLQRVKS